MNHRLDALADKLEASGDYKVLRRLRPRSSFAHDDGSRTKRGAVLDLETTGLDPTTDEIIEIAMAQFTYTEDGRIIDMLPAFVRLREPSKPIPAKITALTGIDDAMVKGHFVDPAEVVAAVAPLDLIIAHNAKFDRPFAERFHGSFATKPWTCSMAQVPWTEAGIEGTKLAYLLNAAGLFHDGHRALDDCRATVELLARPLGGTGRTGLSFLLDAYAKTTFRIWATGAPYDVKDMLRARSYRWNAGSKRATSRLVRRSRRRSESDRGCISPRRCLRPGLDTDGDDHHRLRPVFRPRLTAHQKTKSVCCSALCAEPDDFKS